MLERERLLDRSRAKKWGISDLRGDMVFNNKFMLDHAKVRLYLPDPASPNLVKRFFYRAYNLQISHALQFYVYDFFSSFEQLGGDLVRIWGDKMNEELKRNIFIEQQVEADTANFNLFVSLNRIEHAALDGDQDSLDAITVLHNIAGSGGRLAYVAAHGHSFYINSLDSQVNNGVWWVGNQGSEIEITSVAVSISKMRNQAGLSAYDAIYFNACNPASVDFEMISKEGVASIPVVVHTANSEALHGPAKVYWPG